MPALARGQASNCSNPALDLFTAVNGVLTDVSALAFQVFDVSDAAKQLVPVQVYPVTVGERADVIVGTLCPGGDKLSTGRFVARWTPGLSECLGSHQIRWFFKLTPSSPEQSYREEFEVLPEATATSEIGYCFVADLRAEGVTEEQATDEQLLAIIARASRFIDKCTSRVFEPQTRTYKLDGTGGSILFFDLPIIAIDAVLENGAPVTATEFAIYNRHLSQGLTRPDDRDNPKIEFSVDASYAWVRSAITTRKWRRGSQNIQVSGVFGYTDPDPPSTTGKTPDLIRRCCVMLAFRDVGKLSDPDGRFATRERYRIAEERTRDQSYRLGPGRTDSAAQGRGPTPWTGDPDVDLILDNYRAPPMVRVP
jgi:hypothetical protein